MQKIYLSFSRSIWIFFNFSFSYHHHIFSPCPCSFRLIWSTDKSFFPLGFLVRVFLEFFWHFPFILPLVRDFPLFSFSCCQSFSFSKWVLALFSFLLFSCFAAKGLSSVVHLPSTRRQLAISEVAIFEHYRPSITQYCSYSYYYWLLLPTSITLQNTSHCLANAAMPYFAIEQ